MMHIDAVYAHTIYAPVRSSGGSRDGQSPWWHARPLRQRCWASAGAPGSGASPGAAGERRGESRGTGPGGGRCHGEAPAPPPWLQPRRAEAARAQLQLRQHVPCCCPTGGGRGPSQGLSRSWTGLRALAA